jgi:hypothetical protein
MKARVAAGLMCACLAPGSTPAETINDPTKVDVCKRLPGEDVAAAFKRVLQKVRPMTTDSSSRCVYLLAPPGQAQGSAAGVVLWLYKSEDYDELLKHTEGKIETLQGLGDAAMRFQDPGDGLHKLRVVKRGQFAIEAVAVDPDSSRKLAELALARFSR